MDTAKYSEREHEMIKKNDAKMIIYGTGCRKRYT
jgi:hypothetical protein